MDTAVVCQSCDFDTDTKWKDCDLHPDTECYNLACGNCGYNDRDCGYTDFDR